MVIESSATIGIPISLYGFPYNVPLKRIVNIETATRIRTCVWIEHTVILLKVDTDAYHIGPVPSTDSE